MQNQDFRQSDNPTVAYFFKMQLSPLQEGYYPQSQKDT